MGNLPSRTNRRQGAQEPPQVQEHPPTPPIQPILPSPPRSSIEQEPRVNGGETRGSTTVIPPTQQPVPSTDPGDDLPPPYQTNRQQETEQDNRNEHPQVGQGRTVEEMLQIEPERTTDATQQQGTQQESRTPSVQVGQVTTLQDVLQTGPSPITNAPEQLRSPPETPHRPLPTGRFATLFASPTQRRESRQLRQSVEAMARDQADTARRASLKRRISAPVPRGSIHRP